MTDLISPQPPPLPNDHERVVDYLCRLLQARADFGRAKYGVDLQPFNGRDAFVDVIQEFLDACMYLTQELMEARATIRQLKLDVDVRTRERDEARDASLWSAVAECERPRYNIIVDVLEERERQDAKWGEQNHPSVLPYRDDMYSDKEIEAAHVCEQYELPTERVAKHLCERATKRGTLTWPHIIIEELVEAISCLDDEKAMRKELIQAIAVGLAWVECMDRRAAKPKEAP